MYLYNNLNINICIPVSTPIGITGSGMEGGRRVLPPTIRRINKNNYTPEHISGSIDE